MDTGSNGMVQGGAIRRVAAQLEVRPQHKSLMISNSNGTDRVRAYMWSKNR
jgi:hypothetical protein